MYGDSSDVHFLSRTESTEDAEMFFVFVVSDTWSLIQCALFVSHREHRGHAAGTETFVTSDFTFYFRIHTSDFI
jgi:hypothetical protein